MRAVIVAGCAAVIVLGCTVDFPEPPGAKPDASAGASGGIGGASGTGGSGGLGGAAGSGGASGTGASGGTAGMAGAAGASGAAGSGGTAGFQPIGYWSFDENSGTSVLDEAGTPKKNGSFTAGKITWTDDAKFGKALAFTDGNTGVSIPGWSGASFPPVGTVSFWVKTDLAPTETEHRNLFDKWTPDPARNHIFIRRISGDTFPMSLSMAFQGGSTTLLSDTHGIINNTWHHVAITWNSVTHDGAYYTSDGGVAGDYSPGSFASKPGGTTWAPDEQVFIFGENLVGIIDEVSLYDQALDYSALEALSKLTTQVK